MKYFKEHPDVLGTLIMVTLFICIILLIVFIYQINNQNKGWCEGLPELSKNINGLYQSPEGFYCVWTEGRFYQSVIETENHEICHSLISEDYNHFCGDDALQQYQSRQNYKILKDEN